MIHSGKMFPSAEISAILAEAEGFALPRQSPERSLEGHSPAKRLSLMMDAISGTILPRQLLFKAGAGLVRFNVRNGGVLLKSDGGRESSLRDLAVLLARLAAMSDPLTVSAGRDANDIADEDISCPPSDLRTIAEAALADLGVQTDLAALGLYDQLAAAVARAEFGRDGAQIRLQGDAATLPEGGLETLLADLDRIDADLPDHAEETTLILLGSAAEGDRQLIVGHSSEGTILAVADGSALASLLPVWGAIAPSDAD